MMPFAPLGKLGTMSEDAHSSDFATAVPRGDLELTHCADCGRIGHQTAGVTLAETASNLHTVHVAQASAPSAELWGPALRVFVWGKEVVEGGSNGTAKCYPLD